MTPSRQTRRAWHCAFLAIVVASLGSLLQEAAAQQADQMPIDDGVNLSIPVGPGFKQVPPPPLSAALQVYEASPGRTRVSLSPLSLPKIPSKKEVCAVVEHGSAKIRANAVEKELRLIDLKGPEVEGCYYAATERAPKPGEHKYLYQGAVALRDVLVMFTVLFNNGAEREADTAIKMVRSLTLVPQK